MSPPIDLDAILTAGGQDRVSLLRYCVESITLEPVFLFLAREYAFRPTHAGAVALFDVFCAQDALARVKAARALPPRDLRLSSMIRDARQQLQPLPPPVDDQEIVPRRTTAAYASLFDDVVAAVRADEQGVLSALVSHYDPALSPAENLPGGKMTMGQRAFVDNVWRPRARPMLVSAGFWQMSTID